jgi:hypothetical protein
VGRHVIGPCVDWSEHQSVRQRTYTLCTKMFPGQRLIFDAVILHVAIGNVFVGVEEEWYHVYPFPEDFDQTAL